MLFLKTPNAYYSITGNEDFFVAENTIYLGKNDNITPILTIEDGNDELTLRILDNIIKKLLETKSGYVDIAPKETKPKIIHFPPNKEDK